MLEDIRGTIKLLSLGELLAREERIGDTPYSYADKWEISMYDAIVQELNERGVELSE